MLISVHIPKTAGTSFGAVLAEKFGAGLLRDYNRPMHSPPVWRNTRALCDCVLNAGRKFSGIKCIHGHFLPLKYRWLGLRHNVRFVTWLRDPVERLASNYYHWLRNSNEGRGWTLWRRCIEEKWSLEQFCFRPELRNVCSQFLAGFPLERFDFVGITEHAAEDFEFFADRFLGSCAPWIA